MQPPSKVLHILQTRGGIPFTLAEQMRFCHDQKVQEYGITPDQDGRIPKTGGNTDAELLTGPGVGQIVPRILYEELEGEWFQLQTLPKFQNIIKYIIQSLKTFYRTKILYNAGIQMSRSHIQPSLKLSLRFVYRFKMMVYHIFNQIYISKTVYLNNNVISYSRKLFLIY